MFILLCWWHEKEKKRACNSKVCMLVSSALVPMSNEHVVTGSISCQILWHFQCTALASLCCTLARLKLQKKSLRPHPWHPPNQGKTFPLFSLKFDMKNFYWDFSAETLGFPGKQGWKILSRMSALCMSRGASRLGVPAKGNTASVPRTLSRDTEPQRTWRRWLSWGPLVCPFY